jgi:hypothetical protein
LSGGGQYQVDENLEAQVLAARCLVNPMEALPGVAHTTIYYGPSLCIDPAEQTLSVRPCFHLATLTGFHFSHISLDFWKRSTKNPQAQLSVRENGLAALLNYLDFFSIAIQLTALEVVVRSHQPTDVCSTSLASLLRVERRCCKSRQQALSVLHSLVRAGLTRGTHARFGRRWRRWWRRPHITATGTSSRRALRLTHTYAGGAASPACPMPSITHRIHAQADDAVRAHTADTTLRTHTGRRAQADDAAHAHTGRTMPHRLHPSDPIPSPPSQHAQGDDAAHAHTAEPRMHAYAGETKPSIARAHTAGFTQTETQKTATPHFHRTHPIHRQTTPAACAHSGR